MTPAQQELAAEYIGLARRLATKLHRRLPNHVQLSEVISLAMVGLVDAAIKFDPEVQTAFHPYAARRIRGAILDGLREQDWVSRSVRADQRALDEAEHTAGTHSFSAARLGEIDRARNGLASIHAEEAREIASVETAESEFEIQHLLSAATDLIAALPQNEQDVIILYYYKRHTLPEVADLVGITPARASAIHTKVAQAIYDQVSGMLDDSH